VHKRIFVLYFGTINTTNTIITALPAIADHAVNHQLENDSFIQFLKNHESDAIDKAVHRLNDTIAPRIDCTTCGNCCKTLMIVVEEEEAEVLSSHLHISRTDFDYQYVEKGSNGMMLVNTIPCTFLSNNKCTVYEHRFAGCKEFPALHLSQVKQRLFTLFMHYDRCPIIFNVIENLKKELAFTT
jgi:Fe-S-cluster containining protein